MLSLSRRCSRFTAHATSLLSMCKHRYSCSPSTCEDIAESVIALTDFAPGKSLSVTATSALDVDIHHGSLEEIRVVCSATHSGFAVQDSLSGLGAQCLAAVSDTMPRRVHQTCTIPLESCAENRHVQAMLRDDIQVHCHIFWHGLV
jgi:hypothetical protein